MSHLTTSAPATLRSRAARQLVRDCNAMVAALTDIGAMREPEIAAATGLSEDRVYRAAKEASRLGMVLRRKEDGELSCAPGWFRQAAEAFADG